VAEAATVAEGNRKAGAATKAETGGLAAAGVAALARRDAATATDAQTCGLAAQAAATAADRRAEPYLHAAPNGADLIT
jgi:hypothetical protein